MTSNQRQVLQVSGQDAHRFLQGLVTNDVDRLNQGLVYAALLTPQGKYRSDFFLVPQADAILIDVAASQAADLLQILTMYKLRSDVVIEAVERPVTRGLGNMPRGGFADPRDPNMGWRAYDGQTGETVDWDALRVAGCIPEAGIELTADSYILESGFERLNGVDFKKGCYVGQEVTARMKHKTELRKGLARVALEGRAPIGTEILSGGKTAGTLYTQSGNSAIAYLRFDRSRPDMTADGAKLRYPA